MLLINNIGGRNKNNNKINTTHMVMKYFVDVVDIKIILNRAAVIIIRKAPPLLLCAQLMMDVITAAASGASGGSDGGGGGCRVGDCSAVTTIDGATKLAGGVGGDVSRLSVAFCLGVL